MNLVVQKCIKTFLIVSGYTYGSGSSPNILDSHSNSNNNKKITEEEVVDNDNTTSINSKVQNHPRAVSRSAMVKAVVASESVDSEAIDNKPVKNVCLVDTPQIFPAGNAMTTRAVIESSTGSSTEYVAPNHPKGINRMSCKTLPFLCMALGLYQTKLVYFPTCWTVSET